ncbi:hypothetical protein HKBW3S42_02256, partial [Candidatus Hakubella thermalkaliphila]
SKSHLDFFCPGSVPHSGRELSPSGCFNARRSDCTPGGIQSIFYYPFGDDAFSHVNAGGNLVHSSQHNYGPPSPVSRPSDQVFSGNSPDSPEGILGFIPEFVGRLPVVTSVRSLSEDALVIEGFSDFLAILSISSI